MPDGNVSSIRAQVRRLLEKNHELKPKDICKLLNLNYQKHGKYIKKLRSEWKSDYRNRHALKCLTFHNTRGWLYALKLMNREEAVGRGWELTRARNKMLIWTKNRNLGRLEWFRTGRINIWVKKPATVGRIKQLLANAVCKTELISDVQIFDLWANSARLKGSHLVYDTGEILPYARIDMLKESLGVIIKTGDVTHRTAIEVEFCYPDFAERNEKILEQGMRALEQNSQAFQQLSEFLKEFTTPKATPEKPSDKSMIV